jgi:PIN domain nuclease of toxin-antitoxin system
MRILLDTHIFLWFISGDTQLSKDVRDAIRVGKASPLENPDNEVYLSAISVWEILVKYQLGKLTLPEHPETYLPKQRDLHQILSLALDESSVAQLAKLPPFHRDPFDRMLVCQALQNGLTIATVDTAVRAYPVSIM